MWLFFSGWVLPLTTFIPALLVFPCALIICHLPRHADSREACFVCGLLLGIASYWLPTVLFLILPIWGYLYYRNLFSSRSLMATLIGLTTVAIWTSIFVYMGWIANPWADFFASKNAWGWIPTGAVLLAYLSSTIVRQILRVR